MPALLKRVAFQVGLVPNERAFALSSVSNDGHYISLRPFVKPQGPSEEAFPFEWAFAGTNKHVTVTQVKPNVVNQDFDFWFDVNVYLDAPNTHRGVIKTTWETWESGCLAEAGTVFPEGLDNEGVSFFELWQPLDPTKKELVMKSEKNEASADSAKSIVFKVAEGSGYDGLLIVTGKWAQGFLSKQNVGKIEGLNFIRAQETETSSVAEVLFQYGNECNKFPRRFTGVKVGDVVDVNGLKWDVIESYQ